MEKLWSYDRRDRDKTQGSGQGLGEKAGGQGRRTFPSNFFLVKAFRRG